MMVDGYLGVCIVPDSVDSDEFFEFIVENIVSKLPRVLQLISYTIASTYESLPR